jgi:hypothetical protein
LPLGINIAWLQGIQTMQLIGPPAGWDSRANPAQV